jgi:alpha-beta hydrolase superfamily lysophospholipase
VRRFRAPVLFVAAEEDANFAEDARRLYRASQSPRRQLLIVPGPEHGTGLYGVPGAEEVSDAVDRFLQRVS